MSREWGRGLGTISPRNAEEVGSLNFKVRVSETKRQRILIIMKIESYCLKFLL
jgi:hypothetical protein